MNPTTSRPAVTVRTMRRAELDLALDWSAAEGWNPGLDDAEAFYAADPNGFFLGLLEGEPVGCAAAVAYDDSFGFIGLFIVRPGLRGLGIGHQIQLTRLGYLGERTIGGDSVLTRQDNNRQLGFRPAYRHVRYRGTGGGAAALGVVDLARVPFEEVLAYDREVFPAPRPEFLRRWVRPPRGAARGLVREGRLAGYGVVRACREGFTVGPLFADDEAGAEALFEALAGHAPGAGLFLDVPDANPAAVALARRRGMAVVFEAVRMYRGAAPRLPLHRLFGATTLELG
jgi:ribosomal protein S18 acetylase RimI-like enzyme